MAIYRAPICVLAAAVTLAWLGFDLNNRSSAEAAEINLSASQCFQKPATAIHGATLTPGAYYNLSRPPTGHTYDYRGQKVERLPGDHLFDVEYPTDICVVGPTTIGTQSRSLTWAQVKENYDRGGVHFTHLQSGGDVLVEGARIVNVEDGLGLPRGPEHNGKNITWKVQHAWMEYVRDDAIENDACLDGVIKDVLIDGTQMGFAARPGSSTAAAAMQDAKWLIEDTLVHLDCKPDTRSDNSTLLGTCPKGTSVAQIFKTSACFGRVTMRNTIIRVDAISRNGRNPMAFVPGTYENVTLVWLGPGDYPAPLPPGVRQTKDVSVWNAARAAWLARHGCDDRTKTCSMFGRLGS